MLYVCSSTYQNKPSFAQHGEGYKRQKENAAEHGLLILPHPIFYCNDIHVRYLQPLVDGFRAQKQRRGSQSLEVPSSISLVCFDKRIFVRLFNGAQSNVNQHQK